ncbi:hypothetical protein T492DRAFT_909787, partial [Pavlovales sp. CCMP2436]
GGGPYAAARSRLRHAAGYGRRSAQASTTFRTVRRQLKSLSEIKRLINLKRTRRLSDLIYTYTYSPLIIFIIY